MITEAAKIIQRLRQTGDVEAANCLDQLVQAMSVSADRPNDHELETMDGAVAFHVIDRHAQNWADTGQMMDLWFAARLKTVTSLKNEVDRLFEEAGRSCGSIDTVFGIRFSEGIDALKKIKTPQHQQLIVRLAAMTGEYLTVEQRDQNQKGFASDCSCQHGLDPDCCPVGCGDL